MNIKEHIEAGHYPTDDKGRALVPTSDGRTYCVLAADVPSSLPIAGYCLDRPDIISRQSESGHFLLPPPPRKVKVTYYAEVDRESGKIVATSNVGRLGMSAPANWVCVELTGEYEQPW